MFRHGALLLALGIAGVSALMIYNASMQQVWRPLNVPLQVTAALMRTPLFTVEPGYLYGITISINPGHIEPYADCLLGAGSGGINGDCKDHASALDLLWAVRSGHRGVLASGKYPRQGTTFGYTGNRIDTTIAYFSVPRRMDAYMQLHYRRNAAALGPLHHSPVNTRYQMPGLFFATWAIFCSEYARIDVIFHIRQVRGLKAYLLH